ncbi:MAG: Endonuclease/exonuclease/phosphatase [Thermoleophilia bacterium]|nr:Endonuclease/exonuclease/phosphatase [Thermoleophilia bacterium]
MPLNTAGLDPAIAQAIAGVVQAVNALVQALGGGAGTAQLTSGSAMTSTPAPAISGTAPLVGGADGGGPGAPGAPTQLPVQSPTQTPVTQAPGTPPGKAGGPSTAKVATFNVLGSSHTAAGGNKPGLRSGPERVPGMIRQLTGHGVEIAGLQEFQGDQQAAFKAAKTGFDMVAEKDNAVIWKADKYRKVGQTTLTIPYFEGNARKMPAVQLEDIATGKRVWVLSVHNPADTKDHPHNVKNRREAERRERAFIQQLEATGVPVIVAGDFNDNKEATSAMTQGGLTSVADPAGNAGNIDWMFGSRGVKFGATTQDRAPKQDNTSDHPIVVTSATF